MRGNEIWKTLIAEDRREMLIGMGYDVLGVKKTGESAEHSPQNMNPI